MAEKKVPPSEDKKDDSKPVTAKKVSRAATGNDVAAESKPAIVSSTVTNVKTADLKNRFAAGSIPLATDFGNLIDIAECGRRAVGQSADQTDNTVGVGLALASDTDAANMGKLSVHGNANYAIKVDSSGVALNAGDGLVFSSNKVVVKANTGYAINVDSNGVAVKPYWGINCSSNGVSVTAKSGGGITVDAGGISIDPAHVLPKGMIMMFCSAGGTTIPAGWALCDGSNGTPDLRNRFILGGDTNNWGEKLVVRYRGMLVLGDFLQHLTMGV